MARHTSGYVHLYRRALETFRGDGHAFAIFGFLLMMANRMDGERYLSKQGMKLTRGQVATSFREISVWTGFSRMTCFRAINRLEGRKIISVDSTPSGTIITLPKYDNYQPDSVDDLKRSPLFGDAQPAVGAKKVKRLSATSLATATVTAAVTALRKFTTADTDPRDHEEEALEIIESAAGREGLRLFYAKFPNWPQFAVTWIDQHRRGYSQAFERDMKSDLRGIAKTAKFLAGSAPEPEQGYTQ